MNCNNCNKIINSRNKFCSIECQKEFQYNEYIKKWKNNGCAFYIFAQCHSGVYRSLYKTFLFNKYKNKCSRCGWGEKNIYTGKIPLEVEHIDGNYKNNQEESNKELSIKAKKLIEYIKANNNVLLSIKEAMNYLNIKDRNARMIINELISVGYIVRKGSNKNGFWELNKN